MIVLIPPMMYGKYSFGGEKRGTQLWPIESREIVVNYSQSILSVQLIFANINVNSQESVF